MLQIIKNLLKQVVLRSGLEGAAGATFSTSATYLDTIYIKGVKSTGKKSFVYSLVSVVKCAFLNSQNCLYVGRRGLTLYKLLCVYITLPYIVSKPGIEQLLPMQCIRNLKLVLVTMMIDFTLFVFIN